MTKQFNLLALISAGMILFSSYAMAEPAEVINAKADAALVQFKKEVKGGEAFLSRVKGYIVFPSVIKGGFIVGGEYGEGVPVSYTHLRAHETPEHLVCRLLLVSISYAVFCL